MIPTARGAMPSLARLVTNGSKFRTSINSSVSERGQISNLSPVGCDRKQIPDAHSFRITTIYFVLVLELLPPDCSGFFRTATSYVAQRGY